jgi:hypothetical protein
MNDVIDNRNKELIDHINRILDSRKVAELEIV